MQALKSAAGALARSLTQQQQRTYKNLPVKKNPFVEEWYNAREDMEMTAQITPGMLAKGFFWGMLVPYAAYELIVAEMRASDAVVGRNYLLFPQEFEYEGGKTTEAEEE